MIRFFRAGNSHVYAVQSTTDLSPISIEKLSWLFGNATPSDEDKISGKFVGPRKEMITPWSTNAVEISQNMGIEQVERIEEFEKYTAEMEVDPMLQALYDDLDQEVFHLIHEVEPVLEIDDITTYNEQEGLALSAEEIEYLEGVREELGRNLTDSEVFGFSQVNSEHCRHKIFNGVFIVDGEEMPSSLFKLIKKTSEEHPNFIVSAYKDNVAFISGPTVHQFAPINPETADYFKTSTFDSVISLKAETHNFPTTVEPFNGAATGSGGEIRDRLAGGKGSLPLAGTAVYMTSYPRLYGKKKWESALEPRKWLYQTPLDILIKASDGASDFGNKFGQPLICGSLLTFEHEENEQTHGFDKVIMLAGGVGFGKKQDAAKDTPNLNDRIVVMGGDNYRIGMGGSAVSSVATGEFANSIELNAIQRSNPEMQKRVMNAIRAMQEKDENPIVSIHDHGAGGHLNCLSELVEETGGTIDVKKLPVGDPTLSDKEIVGNESQERMGLVISEKYLKSLTRIAERERAPLYDVGVITGNHHFKFENQTTGKNPIDWELRHMFGSSPQTVLEDTRKANSFSGLTYDNQAVYSYIHEVLQIEAVACKDWLTNKVDRSVTGKVATQQTSGALQLPLNNVAVMALDYDGIKGVATSIGHAPIPALIDAKAGSKLSIAEALTNLVWAPLSHGLKGVSLSANWMWPAKNEGENARLYDAVQAVSDFAIELGINIPTGKDSLSMKQKYPDGKEVLSPGTVIISAVGEVSDITKTITPDIKEVDDSHLVYIDFSKTDKALGGSAFAQSLGQMGNEVPVLTDANYFISCFDTIQDLVAQELILAGHDISSGGLIVTLLEMCFPTTSAGLSIDLKEATEDLITSLFSENPGVVIQVSDLKPVEDVLKSRSIDYDILGTVNQSGVVAMATAQEQLNLSVEKQRDAWFETSYLFDKHQSGETLAQERFRNFKKQPLTFTFPADFTGKLATYNLKQIRTDPSGIKAAIIREKGVNGDREMAWCMHLAGFDVKDVHMTDLINGREDLSDVNFIVFVGGFSNSDVLGSAKGWAGAFLYNEKAKSALENFYARKDTISLGVCNGCQLMMELGLVYPDLDNHPKMEHNSSHKFESGFVNVNIPENNSVMLKSLAGSRLGVWVAHGEGRFNLPGKASDYNIACQYSYSGYPGNPNGSSYNTAGVVSKDGRHLAVMPHFERSMYQWNWPNYDSDRKDDEVSPWIEAFVNAKKWVEQHAK